MDPLAQLKDIHLPQPVSDWPMAMGWIVLFSAVFLSLVIYFWLTLKRWRLIKARRYVLNRLGQLKSEYAHEEDAVAIAIELSQLLRRAALSAFPRKDVAGLKSHAWLAFLDQTGNTTAFTQGPGRALQFAPYQSQTTYEVNALFLAVHRWVKFNLPGIWGRR